ncbi:MAG TPA: S-layer homology domain-containing protein, partial [Negativicutes bacterium]
ATGFAAALTDLPAKHWAYDAVTKLIKANVIEGYDDNTFRGEKSISRYEFAIMTVKAIEQFDRANDEEKQLINKLSAEFADELNRMGVRLTKVEAKTNSWVAGGDLRYRYHVNNPSSGGKQLQGSDKFDWRSRVRFSGQVTDNWTANIRFAANWSNRFGNQDAFGSTAYIDVANAKGTNVLGLDSIKIGRDAFAIGLVTISKSASVDGIWLDKNVGSVGVTAFTGNISGNTASNGTGDSGDAKQFTTGQFTWKANKNLKLGSGYWVSDITGTSNATGTGGLMADNGAGYTRSKGYNLFGTYGFSGLTLLGEYVGTSLKDAVNMPSNPKGWAVQLTNGTGPSAKGGFFGNTPMTNPKKIGDSAWLVGYRRIESGTTPVGLGGFDQVAVAYTSQPYNVFMHGTDNVKGWTLAYEIVPEKNMTLNFCYQNLSIVNHNLTQNLSGNKLDSTFVATLNLMF